MSCRIIYEAGRRKRGKDDVMIRETTPDSSCHETNKLPFYFVGVVLLVPFSSSYLALSLSFCLSFSEIASTHRSGDVLVAASHVGQHPDGAHL